MDLLKTARTLNRMCNKYLNIQTGNCGSNCPMARVGLSKYCSMHEVVDFLERFATVDGEDIVQRWAKENPEKTYVSDYNEKMRRNFSNWNGAVPYDYCVKDFYGDACDDAYCHTHSCEDCWNRTIPE